MVEEEEERDRESRSEDNAHSERSQQMSSVA